MQTHRVRYSFSQCTCLLSVDNKRLKKEKKFHNIERKKNFLNRLKHAGNDCLFIVHILLLFYQINTFFNIQPTIIKQCLGYS